MSSHMLIPFGTRVYMFAPYRMDGILESFASGSLIGIQAEPMQLVVGRRRV